jgi:hypothetical protein
MEKVKLCSIRMSDVEVIFSGPRLPNRITFLGISQFSINGRAKAAVRSLRREYQEFEDFRFRSSELD